MKQRLEHLIRQWGLSVIAMILGGCVIFAMLAYFNAHTEQIMKDYLQGNMEEMNQTAIGTLNHNLDNFSALLEKQAEIFAALENPTDEEILSRLGDFADKKNFKNTAIVTFDGRVYSSFRGLAQVEQGDALPNLRKKETVISEPRIFHDGTLVIDISTPVFLEGAEVGKLVVSLGSDAIGGMFFDNLLRGDAALNLIARDGTVIARTSRRPDPLAANTNAFAFYRGPEVQFLQGGAEDLILEMDSGLPAWVEYRYQGATICTSFLPLGRNGWYMAVAATDVALYAQSDSIRRDAWRLTLSVMAVMMLVSVVVVLQRLREKKRLDTLKDTYSVAIRKTNDLFYEADIDNDLFVDYSEQKDKAIWKETPKNYSNALNQVADVCAPECRQQFLDTFLPQNIRIKMKQGISSINFEYKITPDKNTVRWLSATFVPVDDGTGGTKLICMENDITEHMLKQENLKKSATLDGLTGLYNRATAKRYINWFLENEGVEGTHAFAIIDVDRFKAVNDTLGHAKGDEILAECGLRLRNIFRKSDIVGRLGGDEFIVLLKDTSGVDLLMAKMGEVCEAFGRDHCLPDNPALIVSTSASIGIAVFPADGTCFEELYKAADLALYQSKERGRNQYTFYSPEMEPQRGESAPG